MKLFRKMKKGFTLVELVVVIAVIAILAAVSVGAYFGVTESAKASQHQQEAKSIYTAIQLVANSNSDNHQIDASGLHIVDTEVFEDALNENTGGDYEVYEDGVTAVSGNAIILKQKTDVSGLAGAKTYSSFEYYSPEMGSNTAGVVDIVTGEYKQEGNKNVEVAPLYTTAKEVNDAIAKANADKDTVIKFGSNIEFEDHLAIYGDKKVILDLNGHTALINGKNGIKHFDGYASHDTIGVHAAGGANVTITGNGSVKIIETYECNCAEDAKTPTHGVTLVAAYENSKVTIENGTFENFPVKDASVLYAKESGQIIINGGTFKPNGTFSGNGKVYLFNNNPAVVNNGDEFIVNGGVFYNQDPSKVDLNSKIWNYVSSGKTVTSEKVGNDTIYTVA